MSIKSKILYPFAFRLYSKVSKSVVWNTIIEDIKLWSSKQNISCPNPKRYFINKMLSDAKFRTLIYHRYKSGNFTKRILPPAEILYIRPMTEIAPGGLFLVHPWCTRIGARRIGKNCTIRHETTIGSTGRPDMEELTPIIGDNVDIGCMCGIFGDIKIGNNVKVGAGTILTKSVPDNCVVVGNPAKIIKRNGIRVDILL